MEREQFHLQEIENVDLPVNNSHTIGKGLINQLLKKKKAAILNPWNKTYYNITENLPGFIIG